VTHHEKSCWRNSSDVITLRLPHDATSASSKDSHNTSIVLRITWAGTIGPDLEEVTSPDVAGRLGGLLDGLNPAEFTGSRGQARPNLEKCGLTFELPVIRRNRSHSDALFPS
jgi:hypothetical protein